VFILDTLVIGGLRFVLQRIADAVDAQLDDVDTLREELLAAQMRLELGELSPEEFARLEHDLLARLRDVRARTLGPDDGAMRITGVDVDVADVDDEPDAPGRPRER
jgi:Gas vesicle protein G